jgi:hypothetical protein
MGADDIHAMSETLAADPGSLVFLPLAEALLARGDLARCAHIERMHQDQQLNAHHSTGKRKQPHGELFAEFSMPELDGSGPQAKF